MNDREIRLKQIRSQAVPQFGHAGRHHGNGRPDCPRELHHHHDVLCLLPTPEEWAAAGRTDELVWGSRA